MLRKSTTSKKKSPVKFASDQIHDTAQQQHHKHQCYRILILVHIY